MLTQVCPRRNRDANRGLFGELKKMNNLDGETLDPHEGT